MWFLLEARRITTTIPPWVSVQARGSPDGKELERTSAVARGASGTADLVAAPVLRLASEVARRAGNDLVDADMVFGLAAQLRERRLLFDDQRSHRDAGQPICSASPIVGLHLEITNACNLRCAHRYVSSGSKLPGELTLDELKAVVDMLPTDTSQRVAVSGGEPILRRDCLDLLDYVLAKGYGVDLYTNGYRFPERRLEPLAESARGAGEGKFRLQVSFEGASSKTHDAVRGLGTFSATLQGMERFRAHGLHEVTTMFVCLTDRNIAEVPAMIALANRLEVARLHFSQWQRQGNAADTPWAEVRPGLDDWLVVGQRILDERGGTLMVTGNLFGDLINSNEAVRYEPESGLFPKHLYPYNAVPRVTPDGWIFADQLWTDQTWALGNVREITLQKAFETAAFRAQLESFGRRVERLEECRACQWQDLCGAGSPGHTYAEYGELDHRDLFCEARITWFERYANEQVHLALTTMPT